MVMTALLIAPALAITALCAVSIMLGLPQPLPRPKTCSHPSQTYSWGTGTTRCADCGHVLNQESP